MPVVKSKMSAREIRALREETDVYRCSGCGTVYRAAKPGCTRNAGTCTRKRQVPTARFAG